MGRLLFQNPRKIFVPPKIGLIAQLMTWSVAGRPLQQHVRNWDDHLQHSILEPRSIFYPIEWCRQNCAGRC